MLTNNTVDGSISKKRQSRHKKYQTSYFILHLQSCRGTQWGHAESAHFDTQEDYEALVLLRLVVGWRCSKVKLGGTQGSMGGGGRRREAVW